MARKKLTDLLREEVEKPTEQTGEKVREINAVNKSQMNTPANRSQRSNPTKADLEATIKELRAALREAPNPEDSSTELKDALQAAKERETTLQKQVAQLQSELEQQQKLVQDLKKDLQKLNALQSELKEAKNAAVNLADVNEKLIQQVNSVKKETTALAPQVNSVRKETTALAPRVNSASESPPQEVNSLRKGTNIFKNQVNSALVPQSTMPKYQGHLRPIEKEGEKPDDFAKNTWLL
ncbi:MAG: hypothetical protein KME06_00830 [Kastovskya adunca ATA6-11-RM4]|jgi:chromosome segregation ATPase|nr:hypothetical protein [Kastovskya adunca ATA6-11-RM4]